MKHRTTLVTKGITWVVLGDRRAVFTYARLMVKVMYYPHREMYVVTQMSKEVMSDKSAAVCLDKMTDAILDYYASLIVPNFQPDTMELSHAAE